MRKLLLAGVLLAALVIACENKSPVGPAGVGPGGVVVTQTTSSTTTTTSVIGSTSRRYVAFQPPPNIPSDMTLFFELLTTQTSSLMSIFSRLRPSGANAAAVTENKYKVTGVYIMPNGTTGGVDGQLGGALDPLQTGGTFAGTMNAAVKGCTAVREFAGPLGTQTLQWTGGNTLQDCPGSPLSFPSFGLVSGSGAPLPTTSSTTSTTTTTPTTSSTTSTTSTTTTIGPTTTTIVPTTTTSLPVCTYTVSPTSAVVPSFGTGMNPIQIVITTQTGCPWTAQAAPDFLMITLPESTTGNGTVSCRVGGNMGSQRTGGVTIAGNSFVVTFVVTQLAYGSVLIQEQR